MRRRLAPILLVAALCLPAAAPAGSGDDIAAARALLADAEAALRRAESAEARLAAIGRAISAQEAALAALRRALRTLASEEAAIRRRVGEEEARLGQVLASLQSLAQTPRSAILVYPGGPLQAARAAAVLADVLPALDERMARLKGRLDRLADIRLQRDTAEGESRAALAALQGLRAESADALKRRRAPLARAAAAMTRQADAAGKSATDLSGLAAALGSLARRGPQLGFDDARGRLPLPVSGTRVADFGEADPWGRAGTGWTIEAPAYAQVVAPWDGTVRFAGPLGDYGKVMVLEPENGYLIVMAGLAHLDRRVGEVVLAGEKLGDLGGPLPSSEEFLLEAATDDDLIGRERLYLELRKDGEPVDPAGWFERRDM